MLPWCLGQCFCPAEQIGGMSPAHALPTSRFGCWKVVKIGAATGYGGSAVADEACARFPLIPAASGLGLLSTHQPSAFIERMADEVRSYFDITRREVSSEAGCSLRASRWRSLD